jgi:hypothetical protein
MELQEYQVVAYPQILEYVKVGLHYLPDRIHRQQLADHWPNIFKVIAVGTQRSKLELIHCGVFSEFKQ